MKNIIFALLQLLLLFYLLLTGPLFIFSIPLVLIQDISIIFIFWALLAKRLYKHPVSPHAHFGVFLVTGGPYEIVRHPIYAGLLLFILSNSSGYHTIFQYFAFLLLLVLTISRINRDEELTEYYFKHEFNKYKKTTKRLVPYIY